ncbi:MAG: DUF6671 family protein [Bacillota bacterium]
MSTSMTGAGLQDGPLVLAGRKAVLLSKHRKEQVIGPALEAGTGCELVVEAGFDTDRFGTFTREVPRQDTQLDTARAKARKGIELTGLDLGLGSEGTFGPHPMVGFLPWNREVVLLLDVREDLELCGECASEKTNFAHAVVEDEEDAEVFARRVHFPEHWLVVRPDHEAHPAIIKDVNSWDALWQAFRQALAASTTRRVFLETDMRAHANPTRMQNILAATQDLVRKLRSPCPRCGSPGFAPTRKRRGLPCELCGYPTPEIAAQVLTCPRCPYSEEQPVTVRTAPAEYCPHCNP